jgi:hypothetical protein
MTVDNIEEIKTALASLKERDASTRRGTLRADHHPAPAQQSDLAELHSLLAGNPDMLRLGEILTRRLDGQRKSLHALQDQGREAQSTQAAAAAATAGINARRQALSILAQPFTPPYYVTLDTPFLIWDTPPDLSIFLDSGIEAGNGGWAKIKVNANDPVWPLNTQIWFYFLWENPTSYYAVANVSSSLSLSGTASARGSSGDFSGNYANLSLDTSLTVMRWSGWGTDPETGQSNDQTPYPVYGGVDPVVANLSGFGGDWFHHARPESATFYPQTPYDMSAPLIAIPGQAVTLFEVGLEVSWSFTNIYGQTVEDQPQSVSLDLADDALGYMVQCPMVELEVLTPPTA